MKNQNGINVKNKILWTLLSLLIAAGTVYAVISQTKHFSFVRFREFILDADPVCLVCAVACMVGFIVFEGLAIMVLCREFRFPCTVRNSFFYSAADIYFSAITPSATGGQPACGYFMVKDGIPAVFTTAALVLNLAAYAFSTLSMGLLSLILRPSLLFKFSVFSRILIYIGYIAQIALIVTFTLLLKRKEIIAGICSFIIKLLGKLKLTRRAYALDAKFRRKMEDYGRYSEMMQGKRKMIGKVIVFNLLQRASQLLVTVFAYLATGGTPSRAFDIFCLQSYTTIGVNCIPIPGAMAVTDYMMLDCFGSVMNELDATNLELLSRALSFYSCVIICGAAVVIKVIDQKRRKKI